MQLDMNSLLLIGAVAVALVILAPALTRGRKRTNLLTREDPGVTLIRAVDEAGIQAAGTIVSQRLGRARARRVLRELADGLAEDEPPAPVPAKAKAGA